MFLAAGASGLQNQGCRGAEGARGVASRSSRGGCLTVSSGMGTVGFLLASPHLFYEAGVPEAPGEERALFLRSWDGSPLLGRRGDAWLAMVFSQHVRREARFSLYAVYQSL